VILGGTPAVLTEVLCGFPQFFQKNSRIVLQLGHDHFLPCLHPSVVLPFDAVYLDADRIIK
jgi:hypothetical protein